MNWYKKNLPPGFIYLINKKELKNINDSIGNKIRTVFLDGTAYTESKIYKNWTLGKTSVQITTQMEEFANNQKDLVIYIKLFGVRESNFDTKESLESERERVKNELLEKINKNIEALNNNYPISRFEFISLK